MSTPDSTEDSRAPTTARQRARAHDPIRILILDDDGHRMAKFCEMFQQHTLVMVNTAPMAIAMLGLFHFDVVFLDHDLGAEGLGTRASARIGTGQEVAEALPGGRNAGAAVVIHSWNPVGAEAMGAEMQRQGHKGTVLQRPFGCFASDILATLGAPGAECPAM